MSTAHRVNDVRLEHRIVRYSTQRNAVISQYVRIVLEVLTYFFNGIRLEQWFHLIENPVAVELTLQPRI